MKRSRNTRNSCNMSNHGQCQSSTRLPLQHTGFVASRVFSVLYSKISSRKHKRWEGDGFLVFDGTAVTLKNEDGKEISKSSVISSVNQGLDAGMQITVGAYVVEIQNLVLNEGSSTNVASEDYKLNDDMLPKKKFTTPSLNIANVEKCKLVGAPIISESDDPPLTNDVSSQKEFVSPSLKDAFIETCSNFDVENQENERRIEGLLNIDTRILKFLRPHQKEGISFLYKKLLEVGSGAILADEMGLGKSIQTITLIWLFLKEKSIMTTKNCLIIVPASLIMNWEFEFTKWLPFSRSLLFKVNSEDDIATYLRCIKTFPIAIMSYEMASRLSSSLIHIRFGLVVCDEAQRLKNFSGRIRQQISSLRADRKLLLTGTPVQNDLLEFFSLLDIAEPGSFGTFTEFKNAYDNDPEKELQSKISKVMLRRTAEVNAEWLPPKNEFIIWCRPSELQSFIYNKILQIDSEHLILIDSLRKLCNHPAVLDQSIRRKLMRTNVAEKCVQESLRRCFPIDFDNDRLLVEQSGKLKVFMDILCALGKLDENIVVVSNFTKTLDMLESLCRSLCFSILRLDGCVEQQKRMKLVDHFNSVNCKNTIFLLSTKTGGVGFNLIGARYLVLFDSDWNPAVDLQAMARIWRQGQTKQCYIYRLITAGTIDEKILQRQVAKSGLSSVVEANFSTNSALQISADDLRDLFRLEDLDCPTHELMECECGNSVGSENDAKNGTETDGEEGNVRDEKVMDFDDIEHFTTDDMECIERKICESDTKPIDKDENLSSSSSLAALRRWNHYSYLHEEQFKLVKSDANLNSCKFDNVTFVMKLVSNY